MKIVVEDISDVRRFGFWYVHRGLVLQNFGVLTLCMQSLELLTELLTMYSTTSTSLLSGTLSSLERGSNFSCYHLDGKLDARYFDA